MTPFLTCYDMFASVKVSMTEQSITLLPVFLALGHFGPNTIWLLGILTLEEKSHPYNVYVPQRSSTRTLTKPNSYSLCFGP